MSQRKQGTGDILAMSYTASELYQQNKTTDPADTVDQPGISYQLVVLSFFRVFCWIPQFINDSSGRINKTWLCTELLATALMDFSYLSQLARRVIKCLQATYLFIGEKYLTFSLANTNKSWRWRINYYLFKWHCTTNCCTSNSL